MEGNLAILWKSYKQNQDIYFRDRLIASYKPFLKGIVHHVYSRLPKTVDIMDLESYAYIGLIDAIKKFDICRNIKFETYASYRIKGAIIDGIRKQDWLSRTMRTKIKKSEEGIIDNLGTGSFGLEYNCEDISSSLHYNADSGTDGDARDGYAGFEKFSMFSIDDPDFYERKASESAGYVENLHDIYLTANNEFEEKLENKLFLKKILFNLTKQEKKIVYLYYFRGKTFREIGKIMNITESRVSQINKKILLFLKKEIKKSSQMNAC